MAPTKVIPIPVLGRRNVNSFLLLGRKAVIVDSGIPGSAPKILAGIREHGVSPDDVSAIVITHAHIDHFGSTAELHRATGAPVIAHAADLVPYSTGRIREPYLPTGRFGRLLSRLDAFHVTAEPFHPHLLLTAATPLHDFGIDARILPTPGHTPGSISVLTHTGDLVAGDLIAGSFLGMLPRRPANPPFHDDPVTNLTSLRTMLALNPTTLHAGHGGPLDPARVRHWAEREHHRLTRQARRGRLRSRPADADTNPDSPSVPPPISHHRPLP